MHRGSEAQFAGKAPLNQSRPFKVLELLKLHEIAAIDTAIASNALAQADALRLRGRLQFAEGQVFGRLIRLCLSETTRHAYAVSSPRLSDPVKLALNRMKQSLSSGNCRKVGAQALCTFLLFTDACFDPSGVDWPCRLGGCLFDASGNLVAEFAHSLSWERINLLGGAKKKTVIFEAELLAVALALELWKEPWLALHVSFSLTTIWPGTLPYRAVPEISSAVS